MKLKPFGCTVFHLLHPSFKMPSPKDFNFAYGFRPIYYFSRIFGLMPFTFVYNSKGKIDGLKVGLVDILWLIISITINLTMAFMILGSTQYLYYVKSTSFILEGVDYFLLLVAAILNTTIIGFGICIASKLVGVLKNIDSFDDNVRVPFHLLQKYFVLSETIFRSKKSESILTT